VAEGWVRRLPRQGHRVPYEVVRQGGGPGDEGKIAGLQDCRCGGED
jgi:hypothetical protein